MCDESLLWQHIAVMALNLLNTFVLLLIYRLAAQNGK